MSNKLIATIPKIYQIFTYLNIEAIPYQLPAKIIQDKKHSA